MKGWRPENSEEAVLSTCSTLISIIDDKGAKIVQFSHFSVKEFLTSDRLRMSEVENIRDYYIPLNAAHTTFARACLTVLLQLDEDVDKKRVGTFPLAFYAAQHLVEHAQYEDVESRVQTAMDELFNPTKPYLAAWVWLHDVEKNWDVRSIDRLTELPSPPRVTALYYAALCGFSRVADYLIITHAEDINAMGGSWGAPLNAASSQGHLGVVSLLLQHNANVNVKSIGYYNWTSLHFASAFGHAKVAQLLLEHGADVNAVSTSNSTPLKWASQNGYLEIVRLLLINGADMHIRDDDGHTVFQNATKNPNVEIAQLLLEHGLEKE